MTRKIVGVDFLKKLMRVPTKATQRDGELLPTLMKPASRKCRLWIGPSGRLPRSIQSLTAHLTISVASRHDILNISRLMSGGEGRIATSKPDGCLTNAKSQCKIDLARLG